MNIVSRILTILEAIKPSDELMLRIFGSILFLVVVGGTLILFVYYVIEMTYGWDNLMDKLRNL